MKFYEDPKRAKRAFIITLIFAIIFFISAGTLGYLYYAKTRQVKNINTQKEEVTQKLENEKKELEKKLEETQKELEKAKELSTGDKKALEEKITKYDEKLKTITAYNEFLRYLNQVMSTHGGFDGWTDAEYQEGKRKAQGTGDQALVSIVDWAWNNQSIAQMTRFNTVMKAVVDGIAKNL